MVLRRKNELTKQEKIFFKEYVKTCDGLKALHVAYPKSLNWSLNAQYVQYNKILNSPIMNLKLKEHNRAQEKALNESVILNKRKILNEILRQYSETSENGAAERASSVQLLKLLAQISKLLDTSNNTNININNINTSNINNIRNYLSF